MCVNSRSTLSSPYRQGGTHHTQRAMSATCERRNRFVYLSLMVSLDNGRCADVLCERSSRQPCATVRTFNIQSIFMFVAVTKIDGNASGGLRSPFYHAASRCFSTLFFLTMLINEHKRTSYRIFILDAKRTVSVCVHVAASRNYNWTNERSAPSASTYSRSCVCDAEESPLKSAHVKMIMLFCPNEN